jgi:hypothetical protein
LARTVQVVFALDRPKYFTDDGSGDGVELDRCSWRHGGPAVGPLLALARSVLLGMPPGSELEDLVLDAIREAENQATGNQRAMAAD